MSDPKLISPMLDGFVMGDPISDHDGVRCCPAMKMDSDERYIVKIVSNPATQQRLDALLLTGAYPDKESAKEYFKQQAEDIVNEYNILQKLSEQAGFISFVDHQVIEMTDGDIGYEVYLLANYKRTLLRQFAKKPLTHLGAINLGLDICSALSVARRAGYLYIDLTPTNIYVHNDNEYKIGDIGFIRMDSLKYASIPDKYRSQYTAPEITDAFASPNETIDVYALGLILYQVYNGGALPFSDATAPAEKFPAPEFADYEMSEIILKACDPDPACRWQDPVEMGQALVSYMQRNGANDTPIIPPVIPPADELEEETIEDTSDVELDLTTDPEIMDTVAEDCEFEETDVPEQEDSIEPVDATIDSCEEDMIEADTVSEETIYSEDEDGNLCFLSDEDETTQEISGDEIEYEEVTEEVSQMMAQVDEIAEHPVPEPVVVPEEVEIPMPEPIAEEIPEEENVTEQTEDTSEETADEDFAENAEEAEIAENGDASKNNDIEDVQDEISEEDDADEESDEETTPPKKKTLRNIVLILLCIGLIAAAICFYKFIYIQRIDDFTFTGHENTLTVSVDTSADESKLTVTCADTYGTKHVSPVNNGEAHFTDLIPGTQYTVTVSIEGFHKLEGKLEDIYYTPKQINIAQMDAITGAEDGSAIVKFTIEGSYAEEWEITYVTSGEPAKSQKFTGNQIILNGLTIGKEYELTLKPVNQLYLTNAQTITHKASKRIAAENLSVVSCKDGQLTIAWDTPTDATVEGWSLVCYNDSGYREVVKTTDNTYTFDNIDGTQIYVVEVTAVGHSIARSISVAENSITVDQIHAETTANGAIKLTWQSSVPVPQGGWTINYAITNTELTGTATSDKNELTIQDAIPGQTYVMDICATDGTPVIADSVTITAEQANGFQCTYNGYTVTAEDIQFAMCKTPNKTNWNKSDLTEASYTTKFSGNEKASFIITPNVYCGISDDRITALYVICDQEGAPISYSNEQFTWNGLWANSYGKLNLHQLPEAAGEYSVMVYFNGDLVTSQQFTITI